VLTGTGLLFGILVIGICYLEFPLTQLLRDWIQFLFGSNWSLRRPETALNTENHKRKPLQHSDGFA
jgi:hypothetical protein